MAVANGHPESELTAPKLAGLMTLFVVIGTPLVFGIWALLNEVVTGHGRSSHLWLVVPMLAAFATFLVIMGRIIRRWDALETE